MNYSYHLNKKTVACRESQWNEPLLRSPRRLEVFRKRQPNSASAVRVIRFLDYASLFIAAAPRSDGDLPAGSPGSRSDLLHARPGPTVVERQGPGATRRDTRGAAGSARLSLGPTRRPRRRSGGSIRRGAASKPLRVHICRQKLLLIIPG